MPICYVRKETYHALEELSRKSGTPMSELIYHAVSRFNGQTELDVVLGMPWGKVTPELRAVVQQAIQGYVNGMQKV